LERINDRNIPLGEDQKLVDLFGEVLDSQFNADFSREIGRDLSVQLLDVLTLSCVVRCVLPAVVQSSQQLAARSRSRDSNGEVFNSPVNIADVEVRLEDSELFNLCTEDQNLQIWVLSEESCEFLVDQNQSFTE